MIEREEMKQGADYAQARAFQLGFILDYRETSVVVLEALLADLHEQKKSVEPTTEMIGQIASLYGAYLGETMLNTGLADLGFVWDTNDMDEPCLVRPGSDDMLRPLTRVFKRVINGESEDVVYFYAWCFDAIYTEMGITEGRPGSEFLAPNGKMDAMKAAELLQNQSMFLPEGEIYWDGRGHHFIREVKGNADAIYRKDGMIKGLLAISRQVKECMDALEEDESIRISERTVSPGVYDMIREGDITPITLFNLMSYPGAMEIKREGEDYTVTYDQRLALAIPGFYDAVATLIYDMRAYNDIAGDFQVSFVGEENTCKAIGYVPEAVEGAAYEPDKVVSVSE